MMELFDRDNEETTGTPPPLASRMRPASLDEVAGQQHILSEGKLLRRAIESDRLGSIILYGPPGCGKTSLAEVIAIATDRYFERTSGVLANVAILRSLLEAAEQRKKLRKRDTILFIDEIHRFNKAQQDVLLPYVEAGSITLIGATTHNPFFFINTPLTSRSQIFQLEPLKEDEIEILLTRAIGDERGLADLNVHADDSALKHLALVCDGDARKALNALEIAALTTEPDEAGVIRITTEIAEESIQKKSVTYDNEDGHYDTISAFIKSVRGSDPNAALYWLAKMLYAGEDPRFIARRLIILASEDIGNADPMAITLTTSAMEAVDFIGMPEARIVLAQATTYLSCAPKSNASYMGLESAWKDIKEGRTLPVPKHLRDTSHKEAKKVLGHEGYKYAHNFEGHVVDQEYVPTKKIYYEPTDEGYEQRIRQRIERWNERRKEQRENKK